MLSLIEKEVYFRKEILLYVDEIEHEVITLVAFCSK